MIDPNVLRRRLMIADTASIMVGLAVPFAALWIAHPLASATQGRHLALAVAGLPFFLLGTFTNKLYRARANERRSVELINVAKAAFVGMSLMVVLAFAVQMKDLSRLYVALVGVGVAATLGAERLVARRIFDRLRATGQVRRRIAIVGTDDHAMDLFRLFQTNRGLGYEVVGLVGHDVDGEAAEALVGSYDELEHVLERFDAGGVVVSPASMPEHRLNMMTRRLTDAGYHVAISSALLDIDIARLRPQSIDGHSMIYVEPVVRDGAPLLAKRAFDVCMATSLLVLTAPLLAISAAAIKVTSRGPVLFRQTRVGKDGKLFTMVKLRTMVVDAEARRAELLELNEADGPLFKIARDPRITPVGRVLRKLSIDELPQLTSVLFGSMSMVGPRPALPDEVTGWDDATRDRLRVLPGLTGLWQVSGRSDSSFQQYKRLDLLYVDNWSLKHDLMICVRTVGVVLAGRGAS